MLELQDNDNVELGALTMTYMNDLFTINELKNRPYENTDDAWLSITFEMNLDVTTIERNSYTIFDMFSDVGGLFGIFSTMFGVVSGIWNYNSFDNHMVSRLFKI